jgi:6,7-dimethyl-8-ribityllumazine synthase
MRDKKLRVAILAAAFNEGVVGPMIAAATAEIAGQGGELIETVRVPGAYEIPLPATLLVENREVDLLVVLGFIERGETLHGEVMGQVVHRALVGLQLQHRKPIGIGIVGPGATPEQAETRKEAYARAAVSAAFAQQATIDQLLGVGSRHVGFRD